MATVMSVLWPGMSLENYDDAAEMVNLAQKPPPGLLFHVAGATAEGLRLWAPGIESVAGMSSPGRAS